MRTIIRAILIWIFLQDPGRAASPPCYSPTGDTLPNYGVCDSRLTASLCCHSGDICLSNGLCSTPKGGTFYRGGCSDRSYKSGLCPRFCITDPFTAPLSLCDDDGPGNGISVCCDFGRRLGECCKNASEIMNREAPISSITAGPPRPTAASILQDDDSLPTSTSSDTITFTLSRTVKSSLGSTSLSLSSPNPEVSSPPPTTEPPEEPASRTNLGTGLGGGLGGALALLTGIAIFVCWRRRQKQVKKSETPYHEMDAHDSTYRHNSMLFPAELNEEDSKKSMEPAELPAKLPPGPYELQGDIAPIAHGHAPPTSGKNATIRFHEKPESGDTTLISERPGSNGTTLISEKPGSDATTPASPSGNPKKEETGVKRPAALTRPGSTQSQGGPWHDRF